LAILAASSSPDKGTVGVKLATDQADFFATILFMKRCISAAVTVGGF